jgi:carboxylesterase
MSPEQMVLLIHGAGGGAWQWRDWEPVLQQNGLQSRAIDLLPVPAGLADTRFEDYLLQAEQWFDEIADGNAQAPAVIGASLGALIALKLAESRPVSALVLVAPGPPAAVRAWSYRQRTYPTIVPWASALEPAETEASMPEADAATVRWAHGMWRDESGRVMQAVCDGIEAAAPDCPCLVQCGEADQTVPPAICAETARLLGAEHRRYERVSHVGALLGLYSTILAQEAAGWLARLPGPADRD